MVKLADRVTNFQPPPKDWSDKKIAKYREEGMLTLSELSHVSPYLAARLKKRSKFTQCVRDDGDMAFPHYNSRNIVYLYKTMHK
jgi:(p)ppGpp synthase/HD superfamily hydrolase